MRIHHKAPGGSKILSLDETDSDYQRGLEQCQPSCQVFQRDFSGRKPAFSGGGCSRVSRLDWIDLVSIIFPIEDDAPKYNGRFLTDT